ncbi:hypothetical protein, partial [Umezakia ovalisporum]|uniref:hypothetical protein n=1 Tax=Umezakia ovalisporum TaxID=75695 RepID=UPI0039C5AFD5
MMSTSDMGPLDIVIGDIQMCIEKDLFYAALVVALTLPDICAALETEDGWARKDLYKNWYNTYILPNYSSLSAEDCYNLRCSVVHQGKFGRPGMTYSRVLFTLPDRTNSIFHNNIMNDALNLDVIIF